MRVIPNVLTIAGSDPSGGAGIQADLKTIAALGGYGMAALTALTAQNTLGVTGIHPVPAEFIQAQVDAVFADIRVDAVKIGMLGDLAAVRAVAELLRRHRPAQVVLDPVMIAKGGAPLLAEDAIEALRTELVPLATVVTPNLAEIGVLLGRHAPSNVAAMRDAAGALRELGAATVLLKGGHLPGDRCVDVFHDGRNAFDHSGARIDTRNTHGTGCTLASALATLLARGQPLALGVRAARDYVRAAIVASDRLDVGKGQGPVNHGFRSSL